MATPIETIRAHLDKSELLAQLAEEAAELAQAALKLRRAWTEINPTPVTPQEAYDNLVEELADVRTCIEALDFEGDIDWEHVNRIAQKKQARWAARLEAH